MPGNRKVLTAIAVVAALGALAGCSSGTTTSASGAGTGGSAPAGTITVAAAASLTDAFTAIGKDFEAANPGTTVRFTFDSSASLATQVGAGAPVDVFASADPQTMDVVATDPGIEGTPVVFARNRLVIVTKPGNPKGIARLADLPRAGTIALCAADAPCGRFAARALEEARVTVPESSVTRGQNAKATVTAVSEGDADAGIVYVTDARALGDAVDTVAIADDHNVVATYPVAVVQGAHHASLAAAFVRYLSSAPAQRVLARAGFLAPT